MFLPGAAMENSPQFLSRRAAFLAVFAMLFRPVVLFLFFHKIRVAFVNCMTDNLTGW
jgi:hypothetical protein